MHHELEAVTNYISDAIVGFCAKRQIFHADELREHVTQTCGHVAPGSADRVLRSLRQQRRVDYRVLSRKSSLYEVLAVNQ